MNVISIISCEITQPTGKSYEQAEIAYRDDKGEIKGKKVLSFSNKDVWNVLKGVKAGTKYFVRANKNDKGFWEWVEMKPYVEGEEPVQAQSYQGNKPKQSGSDFRSSEEIIRTTALEVAADLCIANKGKETVSVEQVISMAKFFVTYIRKGEFDPFPIPEDPIDTDVE